MIVGRGGAQNEIKEREKERKREKTHDGKVRMNEAEVVAQVPIRWLWQAVTAVRSSSS